MSESKEIYRVSGQNAQALAQQLNFMLNRISDRIDQLEGHRGTPTFWKNVMRFASSDAPTSGVFTINEGSVSVEEAEFADQISITEEGIIFATDNVTVISATSLKPLVTIENTNKDKEGPQLFLYKNSLSPADGDSIGEIWFYGNNDVAQKLPYIRFYSSMIDVTDGNESAIFSMEMKANGDTLQFIAFDGSIGETVFNEFSGDIDFRVESDNETHAHFIEGSSGRHGFGVASPTAVVNIKAGTATAGTAPIKLIDGTLMTTEEVGALEYSGGKLYFTNILKRKVIDRTSDVAVSTVTVENTTTETTMWTGPMAANSLTAGNLFKFHADGVIQNGGATAADEVTLRIKVGGSTVATLNPTTKAIAVGSHWHIDANATQRTIGASGSRAVHIDLDIDGTTEEVVAVATIDTTANMDVTVTAQWASADVNNIISLYQGFMEYKN